MTLKLKEFSKVISEELRLTSSPISIRFLEKGKEIPVNQGRPVRDLGQPIRPCTAYHLVRHGGFSLTLLTEDFSTGCGASIFIFGILEPINSWIEGDLAYGIYTDSRKAAATMEKSMFRLEVEKFQGITLAPLEKADFIPDLVMIYSDSRQALRLVTAASFMDGAPLSFSMAARGLCSDGVVQPFQIDQPVLSIPCGGDRTFGGTQDNEVVFTTPFNKLDGIIKGLRCFEKSHKIDHLGGESALRKRYSEMAQTLDQKLGRSGMRI